MRPARWRGATSLVAVLAILAAACTGSGGDTTTQPPDPSVATTSASVAPTGAPPDSTAPATTVPPTTTTTRAAEPAGPLLDEIAALVSATEEVRGLSFLQEPDVAVVTTAELAERIRTDVREELGDIAPESRLYRLLGLLEEEQDLATLIEDLLADQVLGFYDGDTGELVVSGDQGDRLTPLSRLVVVHELIHALTDQHFGFHDEFSDLIDEQRFDEAAALQALIEGDATYFQLVYLQEGFGLLELSELQEEIEAQDTTVLDASPAFLAADLGFPYDDGFFFVNELVDDGGIAAVDAAYVEPPATTEHILHPDRFRAGQGAEVVEPLPATDIPGYDQYEESVFGEWGLSLLFTGVASPGLVTRLGDGWGGDRYRILDNGEDVVLIIDYVGDREQDAEELEDAFADRFEELFPGQPPVDEGGGVLATDDTGYGYVERVEDRLVVVVASDPAVGAAVRDLVAAG